MHYYQHHIGDFIRDTSRLTDSQSMTYLRLIWLYYESESPLPDDPKSLAFKVGADVSDVQLILSAFFSLSDGMWFQMRCESEIRKYQKKSEGARAANKARWSESDLKSEKKRIRNQIPTNNQEPITNNQVINISCDDKPKKRFTAPTVEEVRGYCLERSNNVDAQAFVDFYGSKGWVIGKSPMKDWKAAVRTWEKNERAPRGSPPTAPMNKQAALEAENQRAFERAKEMIFGGGNTIDGDFENA